MILNSVNWLSSQKATEDNLKDLDSKMSSFYSELSSRAVYQDIMDDTHNAGTPVSIYTKAACEYIISQKFESILEVGCGSGQFYQTLRDYGYKGKYVGIEMAPYIIAENSKKFPDALWFSESVYNIVNSAGKYDCCISMFVLEHLVFPERALKKMMKQVFSSGKLVLIFPDFKDSMIFPSQKIGKNYTISTKQKLKKGLFLDAVISYLEGRLVRKYLKNVNNIFGDFVINFSPYCLTDNYIFPDSDAIYLSNKDEIENWATRNKLSVDFPYGKKDAYSINAFIVIQK